MVFFEWSDKTSLTLEGVFLQNNDKENLIARAKLDIERLTF